MERYAQRGVEAEAAGLWVVESDRGAGACVDSAGTAFVIRAGREFKLLETNDLEAMNWCMPALANGHLFVRTASTLFCIVALASPPPPPGVKGKGGPSGSESAEMQTLLKSFNLTADQQAKYDAAKKKTSEEMRAISVGKRDGTLTMPEVLKKALASHKAFNAEVKSILTPEQFAKWEPLRESDHHKIAQAHKARDEAAAKAKADTPKSEK